MNKTELPITHREKFSPLPTKEPKPNAFSANSFDPQEETTTELSDLKTPIRELYAKWSTVIHFLLGMLAMAMIASYGYGSKYEKLMTAIEKRGELIEKMEYNNTVIKGKIDENAKIRNQILSDNEMMVEAIKNANKVKEAKIVNSN
jgi:hypothetical protein